MTKFREPYSHENVPGHHRPTTGASPTWCLACTNYYSAPVLWPCATHDYQEDLAQHQAEQE